MKDLNFFEPYIEKKEINIDRQLIYYTVAILLIGFTVSYSVFNQIKIRRITRDVVKLKLIAEDEKINSKVKEINDKEKEVSEFKKSVDNIKTLDKTIEDNNIIDSNLLDDITLRIPEDIFFTSISIYTDNIQIIGIGKDKWSIAELGESLESVEGFKEIFITNISSEEEYYNFTLNINLKDVNINGEDEIPEKAEDEETTE